MYLSVAQAWGFEEEGKNYYFDINFNPDFQSVADWNGDFARNNEMQFLKLLSDFKYFKEIQILLLNTSLIISAVVLNSNAWRRQLILSRTLKSRALIKETGYYL